MADERTPANEDFKIGSDTVTKVSLLSRKSSGSSEETPPALPPRPPRQGIHHGVSSNLKPGLANLPIRTPSSTFLGDKATTAVTLAKANTPDITAGELTVPASPRTGTFSSSDVDDTQSVRSLAVTVGPVADAESMLGEVLEKDTLAWKGWSTKYQPGGRDIFPPDPDFEDVFEHEFDELDDITSDGLNEEAVLKQWKSKLKQYFILSRAGKPVWSRHGNDQLVTSYIGVILTLISFYEGASDSLRGFTAGSTRFVVLTKDQLYLVAVSGLDESDQQLRSQLEALYMQVLSTLTLPVMERMFKARASTDLRRPLQGTEKLLSALADGFTRGSPSTLLTALECLKMRKAHRQLINSAFLKTKSENMLYGLIVAGGRLVSVVRPRKHSLHPGDLHLIFNMLFEAGGIKAGEGENWIPLCLPGFNNTGYVYMYVSFLGLDTTQPADRTTETENLHEVAVILISANKEAFFELQNMKNDLTEQMQKNGSLGILRNCVRRGRPNCIDIAPGTNLKHFLYKSKANVQFIMPSFDTHFQDLTMRRRLLSAYSHLHSSIHSRPAAPKIHHSSNTTHTALAWNAPTFDLYAVASINATRAELSQAANRILQYVRREEERLFIIGGAVF